MISGLNKEQRKISQGLEQWIKKLKCSGSTGIGIESFEDIKVGVDPSEVDVGCVGYDPITDEDTKTVFTGETSTSESVRVKLKNGDVVEGHFKDGLRHGLCKINCESGNVTEIKGEYKEGKLEGKARITFKDRSTINGYFKSGILHGFARYFDKKGRLKFVGNHKNGRQDGTCWRIIRGGGCVVGRVDKTGQLTGMRIAYIYPDYITALVGSFNNGIMERAQEAVLTGMLEDDAGIKIPIFSKPEGHFHVRQIGTYDHICSDPTASDPYESKLVEVCNSGIDGAHEGLFAKEHIEVNTTVAFYNGSRADPRDFDPSTWETNNYKIFDPADMPQGTIDIPTWAQSSTAYCASLAHKTNHSFHPNAQFVVFDHPKFGLIPCISTIADIPQGEEILVGYGYDFDESPDWYQQAWKNSSFGQQGVDYKDWLECNVKNPLALNGR